MAKIDCEKCLAVLDFIQLQREHPPPVSFEVEEPIKNILEGIERIINSKTPLELAVEQVKKTGSQKDLKKLLKARKKEGL